MLNSTIAAGIALTTLVMVSDINARGKWEKHGSDNGITVFTTQLPESRVPQVKAVTIVDAPTDKVWAYITDSIKIEGLKVRKTVDSCGNSCDYVYVRLGNWMITDRHYVIRVTWSVTDMDGHTRYTRSWRNTRKHLPSGDDVIPVRDIQGSWTLTPIDNGRRTKITYINHLDLGGSVPPKMFTRGFVNKAYDILKNVRDNA